MWQTIRELCGRRRFRSGAGLLGLLVLGALLVRFGRLPRPPEAGIVATYRGGKVTETELRRYLHEYLPRCPRHLRCARHGEEHESCDDDEACETFAACDDGHGAVHSLSLYRQAAVSLVVDRLIGDLVAERKLGERKETRHLMKHVTEEINLADLHQDWHKDKIRVEESELEDYYEANRDKFGARTLAEVAEDIRALLTQEKETAFVQDYLTELRENSSISINYELLDYPQPDEEQLRTAFFERRDEFRRPARVECLRVEVASGGDAGAARELARRARDLLVGGAGLAEVQESLADESPGAVATTGWVSEGDALWKKMELARRFPGEVTDIVEDAGKLLVARVEQREEARPQEFDEVRGQLAQQLTRALRQRHLDENRNATLFTIHGEPYSLGDFAQEFRELPPAAQAAYDTFDGRKKLADSMVERSLVLEDTSDELRSSKNRKRIERIRLAVLKQMLHQEEVDDRITITDQELRDFFEKNRSYYRQPVRVRISLIRVDIGGGDAGAQRARQRAEEALSELETLSAAELVAGGFARVARRYSDDPHVAETGGEIGDWISEGNDLLAEMLGHELHENVLGLGQGELSPVFRAGDSFCVALVRERQEARERSFAEAQELVREDLTEIRHYERTSRMEVELVRKAGAKIYDYTLIEMLKEEARDRE